MEIWDPVSTRKFTPELKLYTLKRAAGTDAAVTNGEDATELAPVTTVLIGDQLCCFAAVAFLGWVEMVSIDSHCHHT